ncbi:MAG: polysaccharide deacetylase family protein [Planctomycetia bacterium]|nr:polysaccharide deacetylase family protein [Planctomycetia bacterium]
MPAAAPNAFTVDLEGWYQSLRPDPDEVPLAAQRDGIREGVDRLLELCGRRGVKATWFTLGSVAELMPAELRAIAGAGHEVASHGYGHDDVDLLGAEGFAADLAKAEGLIEGACGAKPRGYRSPKWSAGRAGAWYFDALRQRGYAYDSSLNPVPLLGARGMRHDVHRVRGVAELPPTAVRTLVGGLPCGGSVGLRNLTHRVIARRVAALNAAGEPAMFWVHPWELAQKRLAGRMPLATRLVCNVARVDLAARLDRLFGEFPFGTAQAALDARVARGPLPEVETPAFREARA